MKIDWFIGILGILAVIIIASNASCTSCSESSRVIAARELSAKQSEKIVILDNGLVEVKPNGDTFRRYKIKRLEKGVVDYVTLTFDKKFSTGDTILYTF